MVERGALITITVQGRKDNGDLFPSLIEVFNGFSQVEARENIVNITAATGSWACFKLKNPIQVERFLYMLRLARLAPACDLVNIVITPEGEAILMEDEDK